MAYGYRDNQGALSYSPGQMSGGNTYNNTPAATSAPANSYNANSAYGNQRGQSPLSYSPGQLSGGNTYSNPSFPTSPGGNTAPTGAPGGNPYSTTSAPTNPYSATNAPAAGPQPYTPDQIKQLEAYRDQQRIWQAQNPGVYKNEWDDPNNPAVQIARALNPNYGTPTTAQLALPASPFSYGYPTGSPADAYTATRTWGQMMNDRENGTAAGMASAFPNGTPNVGNGLGPRDPGQVANLANMYLQNIANTYGRMGSETPGWVGQRMVDMGGFDSKGQYTGNPTASTMAGASGMGAYNGPPRPPGNATSYSTPQIGPQAGTAYGGGGPQLAQLMQILRALGFGGVQGGVQY